VKDESKSLALDKNDGPKKINLIVTNLDTQRASDILNLYSRRWSVECTFREFKSGLHWGQMQVTKEKERVKRRMILPVISYLSLLRLYGSHLNGQSGERKIIPRNAAGFQGYSPSCC